MTSGARSSYSWSLAGRAAVQGIAVISTIALSRFLGPAEYGLVAYVAVFVGVSRILVEAGVGAAVVWLPELSKHHLDTAFWFNQLLNWIAAGALYVSAPWLANLFDTRLEPLLKAAGLVFLLAVSGVHASLMQREMRFRSLALIESASALMGLGVSVIAVVMLSLGPMGIVAGVIANTLSMSILAWLSIRFHPGGATSRGAMIDIWQYSRGLVGFNIVNFWARNVDNVIVGFALGAAALGLYDRAYLMMALPVFVISAAFGRVSVRALSRGLVHGAELDRRVRRLLKGSSAVGFPISLGLACTATPLVEVAYGESWNDAAPVLAILAAAGPAQIVNGTVGSLLQATGRTGTLFKLGVVGGGLVVVSVSIGLAWGIYGVAFAYTVQAYLNMLLVVAVGFGTIGLATIRMLWELREVAVASMLLVSSCWGITAFLPAGVAPPAQLALLTFLGAAVYVLSLSRLAPDIVADLRGR